MININFFFLLFQILNKIKILHLNLHFFFIKKKKKKKYIYNIKL
jgi:hypothetical protein